jgi:hypothetical protein
VFTIVPLLLTSTKLSANKRTDGRTETPKYVYDGIERHEQWNYHLGKMYGYEWMDGWTDVPFKKTMLTNVQS